MRRTTSAENAIRVAACCLLSLLLTGCGSGDGPVPVTGKVTLDGKPVSDASVTFTPASQEGRVAVGATDDSGMYSLNLLTGEVKDGAMPGAYKVSISKGELVGGKPVDDSRGDSFSSLGMSSGSSPRAKLLIPVRYSSVRTSGLSFEVKRGVENTADFELSE